MNHRNKFPLFFHYWIKGEKEKEWLSACDDFELTIFRTLISVFFTLGVKKSFSAQYLAKIITGNKNAHLMETARKNNSLSVEKLHIVISGLSSRYIQIGNEVHPLLPIRIDDKEMYFYDIPRFIMQSNGYLKIIPIQVLSVNSKKKYRHQDIKFIVYKFFILDRILQSNETEIVFSLSELQDRSGISEILQNYHKDYIKRRITYKIYLKRKKQIEKNFLDENVKMIFENLKEQKVIRNYRIIKYKKITVLT